MSILVSKTTKLVLHAKSWVKGERSESTLNFYKFSLGDFFIVFGYHPRSQKKTPPTIYYCPNLQKFLIARNTDIRIIAIRTAGEPFGAFWICYKDDSSEILRKIFSS